MMQIAPPQRKCLLHRAPSYRLGMSTTADRLRQARVAAGFDSAGDAAAALGVSAATYRQHENGTRGYPASKAEHYARRFRVTPEWLLYGRGDEPTVKPTSKTVPLVGYVGAGSIAHYYGTGDGGLDEVPAPENATASTVAAEVRGTSLGPFFERWLVFWDEVRNPPTPDLFGQLCVVGLPDDRVLVKQLKPASAPGRFHLLSNGTEEPIFDAEVVWAALVKNMKPR